MNLPFDNVCSLFSLFLSIMLCGMIYCWNKRCVELNELRESIKSERCEQ